MVGHSNVEDFIINHSVFGELGPEIKKKFFSGMF